MSFRRSNAAGVESSRWRCSHQDVLVECGIPAEVAASDRRWVYVLLHGDDHLHIGWNASWVTPGQASRLLGVLEAELSDVTGYDLVALLRRRASEGG